MAQQLRYSKEEFARRGNEIYESQVRPQVEEGNHGKIVAGSFAVPKATISRQEHLSLQKIPSLPQIDCLNGIQMLKFGAFGLGIKAFIALA